MYNVNICVCTFRRPQLAQTLQSLAELELPPHITASIIVADNDDTPSAVNIIARAKETSPFRIIYLHAPSRNIAVARNACLEAATAPFVAFIDDDEIASPTWLVALLAQHNKTNAEIVLGPVQSRYPDNASLWLRREDFHSIKPVWVNGTIITGYTSNVLMARTARAIRGRHFDPALGRSGGEDTLFFSQIHENGGHIDFANDAIVYENVARDRLTLPWLLKRYFRFGQTHGMIILTTTHAAWGPRIGYILLAFFKMLVCTIAAVASLFFGQRAHYWLLRGTLHMGVIARLLGQPELTQYG
jgi:succinoglycan biosynthesis protein ExoM